jgi:hypothetical protein
MQSPDKKKPEEGRPSPAPDVEKENQNVAHAYEEASKDIDEDPDLSIHSPNDDLDEGETARLGEDKTDLV